MNERELLNALAQAIKEKDIFSTICHLKRLDNNPLGISSGDELDIDLNTRTDTLWLTISAHSKRGEFNLALSTALVIQKRMRLMKR